MPRALLALCILFPACAARPVGRKEIEASPEAARAEDAEWRRLRDKEVWIEWREVEEQVFAREVGTVAEVWKALCGGKLERERKPDVSMAGSGAHAWLGPLGGRSWGSSFK